MFSINFFSCTKRIHGKINLSSCTSIDIDSHEPMNWTGQSYSTFEPSNHITVKYLPDFHALQSRF